MGIFTDTYKAQTGQVSQSGGLFQQAQQNQLGTLPKPGQDYSSDFNNVQASQDAKQANSFGSIAQQTIGGTADSLLTGAAKFAKSAAYAPFDIGRGLTGQLPIKDKADIQTIQSESVQKASDVFDQKKSPIRATAETTGKTVAGAADFLGVADGLGAVKNKAESYLAPKVESSLQKQATEQALKKSEKAIETTMPLQNKEVRIDSLRNSYPESSAGKGGVAREGVLGKSKIQYTPEDMQRGKVASEYLKGEKDPVKQIQNVNQGIREESIKTDSLLDKHSSNTNFEDMRKYLESNNKPDINIQRDPMALESYKRSTENALKTLYNTMKETATKTGDFGAVTPGKDIRAARIAIDQQISRELGEEVFGTPQYKGIKAAEVNVRNIMNRMLEDTVRYPNQLENLNKYNEFVQSMKSRNPDIKIDPVYDKQLKKVFGLSSTPESEVASRAVADQHSRMSNLYEARDNMIDRYQKNVGKNKIQEAISNNPAVKGVVNFTKKVIPFGIGSHL